MKRWGFEGFQAGKRWQSRLTARRFQNLSPSQSTYARKFLTCLPSPSGTVTKLHPLLGDNIVF